MEPLSSPLTASVTFVVLISVKQPVAQSLFVHALTSKWSKFRSDAALQVTLTDDELVKVEDKLSTVGSAGFVTSYMYSINWRH